MKVVGRRPLHALGESGAPVAVLLDESTDVANLKQLLIYIRYVDRTGLPCTILADVRACDNGSIALLRT